VPLVIANRETTIVFSHCFHNQLPPLKPTAMTYPATGVQICPGSAYVGLF